ncbi:MAG: hypothetical protein LBJ00_12665 [Planctomycetaceae bacterium]|nr:hypothetical protein [Planctomycetaceae bacterium]
MLVYIVVFWLPPKILVWRIASGNDLYNVQENLIWNQRTMIDAVPILVTMHWNIVLEERFLNCEDCFNDVIFRRRLNIWKALIEIDKSTSNEDIARVIELYFIVHARSSDIRRDEYELLCDLFKAKKLSYKWSIPEKFANENRNINPINYVQ